MSSSAIPKFPGKNERWYVDAKDLDNTPSIKQGMPADKELYCRQQAATFIQDMGHKLKLSQLAINTAIVYMHRFYVFHSFSKFQRNDLAAAALFLAAKVEEIPKKLDHVVRLSYAIQHQHQPDDNQLEANSNKYLDEVQKIGIFENVLLQTLGFDLQVDHPHTNVVKCCQLVKAPKDLAHASYFLATDSLHLTTFCLRFRPTVVACVCIHLACKWVTWEIPVSREGKQWFTYVDKDMTIELLEQISDEFVRIMEKSPNKLKLKKIICEQAAKEAAAAAASGASNSGGLGHSSKSADVQQPGSQIPGGSAQKKQKLLSPNSQQQQNNTGYYGTPPVQKVDIAQYRERQKEITAHVKPEPEYPISQTSSSSATVQRSIPPPSSSVPVVPKLSVPPPADHPQQQQQRKSFMPDTSAPDPWMNVNDFTGNSKREKAAASAQPPQQSGIPLQMGMPAKPAGGSAHHRPGGGYQTRPDRPQHHGGSEKDKHRHHDQHKEHRKQPPGQHHAGSTGDSSKHAGSVKGPPPHHHQSKHAEKRPRPPNEGPAAGVQPPPKRPYASSAAVPAPSRDKFVPPPPPRAISPRAFASAPTSVKLNFASPPPAPPSDMAPSTPQPPPPPSDSESISPNKLSSADRQRDKDRRDRLEQRMNGPSTTSGGSSSSKLGFPLASDFAQEQDRSSNGR